MTNQIPSPKSDSAREKLLAAAVKVIREHGYTGTSVDDLCTTAGVTKGAFFHHFKSKEDLAVAAAQFWSARADALFSAAPYHQLATSRERVLGYLDFRIALIRGTLAEFTCLAGTMTQEVFLSNPAIRDACCASMSDHAETLVEDISDALKKSRADASITARSLALHTQTVLQGAFILAKARNDPEIAIESITHLRRYFEFLFNLQ
jgi:TetR/AcrR family transcriptional regulator, transcriptional repressor for nem operon